MVRTIGIEVAQSLACLHFSLEAICNSLRRKPVPTRTAMDSFGAGLSAPGLGKLYSIVATLPSAELLMAS